MEAKEYTIFIYEHINMYINTYIHTYTVNCGNTNIKLITSRPLVASALELFRYEIVYDSLDIMVQLDNYFHKKSKEILK
jgi:hypothetical protein